MKAIITYLIVAILTFGGVYGNVCNTSEKSSILQSWQEDWGNYVWGEDPQANQYYVVETNGAFKDMLRACDVVGSEQILHILGKNKIISLQMAEGSYLDIVLQEDINPLVVKFLLDNELILFEDLNLIDYKQFATQKLQEAEAKEDFRAIQNYEKIIKLVQEYEAK
ncbi:hypothetical protein NHP164001_11030 [Helicobacter trogontum]|uniref:Bypass of forespore C C-terminal domain-containing protein n=1 Tax=Helicobacter trogontum TaxID=50960 RepID=A0ABQ0D421_9HELI